MQPFQQRVVDEKTALDEKLAKLMFFITGELFAKIDPAEQLRLMRQSKAMEAYSAILAERIENFKEQ